ncbi:hypothetical protein OG455_33785 [Kitasatospora sp. NBC_01287]|uniref:hypothetical protein n=1 Tax=Kitasatospora sp. NBC_01287 TaxID=2903573 RepID=UPI0022550C79|nr:hypothetical protein [Kitasatospora sp. NBC_01287]MCX4750425.1 hypothetical protein [Kitasatospora sp. NBC_01287]
MTEHAAQSSAAHSTAARTTDATTDATTDGVRLPPLPAGRRPAGSALLRWLDDPQAPRLCLVTGASGSGRSHLLRWLATARPPTTATTTTGIPPARPTRQLHVLLDAAGLSPRGATWQLGRAFARATRTPAALLAALARLPEPPVIAVTDLQRAADPAGITRELLGPLLTLPGLRLLVEGAPVPGVPEPAVLDLDDPRWTDPQRFAAWCATLGARPENVYPSPGLALLAARTAKPSAASAPGADTCQAWWAAVPEELRPALRALAAADLPLTERQWAALPRTGGEQAVRRAAALLPAEPGGTAWRLRPDRLATLVAASGPAPSAAELAAALGRRLPRTPDGTADLTTADPEVVALLAEFTLRAGSSADLLGNAQLLIRATPATIGRVLDQAPAEVLATLTGRAWNLAGPAVAAVPDPGSRSAVLRLHLLAQQPTAWDGLPWQVDWTRWTPVLALTLGQGPYEDRLLVLTPDGRLRELNPEDGRQTDQPRSLPEATGPETPGPEAPGPAAAPDCLACTRSGDLLLLGPAGAFQLVPPPTAVPNRHAAVVASSIARALGTGLTALAPPHGMRTPGLAAGDTTGHLHWFRTDDSDLRSPEPLHQGPVSAVAATDVAATNELLLASGGLDGQVRVWAVGRPPLTTPADARPTPVTALALADSPSGPLLVTAWADGFVRIRRLTETDPACDLLLGSAVHSAAVDALGRIFLATPDGILSLRLTD